MELAALGLTPGEAVRFRRGSGHWQLGRARNVERDGSLGIVDANGASRSLAIERVEVRVTGRRGGRAWEPLAARAARTEQLRLL
jgi:hypothetical protein